MGMGEGSRTVSAFLLILVIYMLKFLYSFILLNHAGIHIHISIYGNMSIPCILAIRSIS